ncbi:hypothetical protein ACFUCV_04765 [Specibacter sp. NPDC057265]|uniref:hypothetical protein n=1 Tax=Specibacter sp. NPDC057265 TaxID=3346075 RepID=UPI00364354C4
MYLGGTLFGGSYVALGGVLIAWAAATLPGREPAGTAALFIVLVLGQAQPPSRAVPATSLLSGPRVIMEP